MDGLRDLPDEACRFDAYLRDRGVVGGVTRWEPLSGGRSATSVRVGFVDEGRQASAVLHLASDQGPLAGVTDIGRQYELLQALAELDFPSPRPMGLLTPDWLGRSGYLSEFVPGHVPDPWRASGRAFIERRRERIESELLARLAEIHALPVEQLPLSTRETAGKEAFGQRERRRWSAVVGRSPVFSDDPLIAYADAWLEANCPPCAGETLIHGDYRIGNLVFDDHGRIISVLDWELAEIGDPVYDIATLCSPALEIDGKAAGIGDRDRLVGGYEARTGRSLSEEALAFYRILGTFKIVCLWVNASLPGLPDVSSLTAVRAHFSVLEARPLLAAALGLAAGPARAAANLVLAKVARELRATERDLADKDARDAIRTCAAIIAACAGLAPVDMPDTAAIRDFAAELGASGAVARCDQDKPLAGLAAIVRTVMHDPAIATQAEDATHRRLRALLAQTLYASPSLAGSAGRGHQSEGAGVP